MDHGTRLDARSEHRTRPQYLQHASLQWLTSELLRIAVQVAGMRQRRRAQWWRGRRCDRLVVARDRAEDVLTLGPAYDVALLHRHNARLVADGDALVAVHDPHRHGGGTASTIRRARHGDLLIIRVDVRHRRITLAA